MRRVTGVGGIFFKSPEPEKLQRWYELHLGIARNQNTEGRRIELWEPVAES